MVWNKKKLLLFLLAAYIIIAGTILLSTKLNNGDSFDQLILALNKIELPEEEKHENNPRYHNIIKDDNSRNLEEEEEVAAIENSLLSEDTIIARYWELKSFLQTQKNVSAISNDPKLLELKENKITFEIENIGNLWKSSNVKTSGPDSTSRINYNDRIVAQLVWEMEAAISPELIASLPEKWILIGDDYRNWNLQKVQDQTYAEFAPDRCASSFGYASKCKITNKLPSNTSLIYATVAAQKYQTELFASANSNVLGFKHTLESPVHAALGFGKTKIPFYLATFWRNSEIVTPYAKWLYYDPLITSKPTTIDYSVGKSQAAAIFVSHCDTRNNRLKYVKELQKFIPVHIFGGCGDMSCSRNKADSCFEMLRADYYFYLSFENSNCRDYITEKLYANALENNVVPIVMGAHPDDYRNLAPANSYIHVDDFESPAQLADYMNFLMNNSEVYNKYFRWKGTGEFIRADFLCRLCSMMYYHDLVPLTSQEDASNGWKTDNLCTKKGKYYWNS